MFFGIQTNNNWNDFFNNFLKDYSAYLCHDDSNPPANTDIFLFRFTTVAQG